MAKRVTRFLLISQTIYLLKLKRKLSFLRFFNFATNFLSHFFSLFFFGGKDNSALVLIELDLVAAVEVIYLLHNEYRICYLELN